MNKTIKTQPVIVKRQQGWTMWSMMFVMSVVFIAAYIGMQLVPIYSANESVIMAMRSVVEGKNLQTLSKRQIVGELQKKLYIDGNHELFDYKKDLKVSKMKNIFIMEVDYEREVPLVANLFMVARFSPKIECQVNGSCDP